MGSAAIKIDTTDQIPAELLRRLKSFAAVFRESETLDPILEVPDLKDICRELNEICLRGMVRAYHFTRADRDSI